MDVAPISVQITTPLSQVYRIYRGMVSTCENEILWLKFFVLLLPADITDSKTLLSAPQSIFSFFFALIYIRSCRGFDTSLW